MGFCACCNSKKPFFKALYERRGRTIMKICTDCFGKMQEYLGSKNFSDSYVDYLSWREYVKEHKSEEV